MTAITVSRVQRAVSNSSAWEDLVVERRGQLSQFLRWASACEGDAETSLRLDRRDDIARCQTVLPLFEEPWWGVVVYSCFDSLTGAQVAAQSFRTPLSLTVAAAEIDKLEFPRRSVQHHRAQVTLTGARRSLVSVCEKSESIRQVLCEGGASFDERFEQLMMIDVAWWARTTCFDVLLRAGALGVGPERYRPEKAYLLGSQGPAAGFEQVWGLKVTRSTAETCEQILMRWTQEWHYVAEVAGVSWDGDPYDSADFENALCVYQEPPRSAMPDPSRYATGTATLE